MLIGRLPLDEQLDALRATLTRNQTLMEVLGRSQQLDLPGWYLTAGAVFQTVWNVVTDRPPTWGIKDYDLFYFDDSDLSWDAEDEIIRAGQATFGDLPAAVEIRNEARVHLWYQSHFGVPCPPHPSTQAPSIPSRPRPVAWASG